MNITLHHAPHLFLSPEQKTWVEEKARHTTHFADRLGDASSEIRVDLHHDPGHKSAEDAFECRLTVIAPHGKLHAQGRGNSVEASVNGATERLSRQAKRYKFKLHRINKRQPAEV